MNVFDNSEFNNLMRQNDAKTSTAFGANLLHEKKLPSAQSKPVKNCTPPKKEPPSQFYATSERAHHSFAGPSSSLSAASGSLNGCTSEKKSTCASSFQRPRFIEKSRALNSTHTKRPNQLNTITAPKSGSLIVLNTKKRDLRSIEEIMLDIQNKKCALSGSKDVSPVNETLETKHQSKRKTFGLHQIEEELKKSTFLKKNASIAPLTSTEEISPTAPDSLMSETVAPEGKFLKDNAKISTTKPHRNASEVTKKQSNASMTHNRHHSTESSTQIPATRTNANSKPKSAPREDTEEYYEQNYSSIIANMFGYDKSKYADEVDELFDDSAMESNLYEIEQEESRSRRIALQEDDLEQQLIEEASRKKRRLHGK